MILYHGSFGKDATDYDLVVGGVANDKVFNTVQICFRTERALSLLHFEGSEIV